ncbi:MAG: molybdate ABC transporter substrate-binding protein, partial [Solirubrobacteraceae bacterium]
GTWVGRGVARSGHREGNFRDDRAGGRVIRRVSGVALAALVLIVSGCGGASSSSSGRSGSGSGGGGGGGGGGGAGKPNLTVSAAASLTKAFTEYGTQFSAASARFSFAGSDQLAAQIEQGVKPDVFASANLKLPNMLFAKGLVSKPVVFTSNRLVIAVPAGSSKIRSLADLAKPGVKIANESPTVPAGAYTLMVLSHLSAAERRAILANVRTQEPDVKGVIAKVAGQAVDAGFVYITDVTATAGKTAAVTIPDKLQPQVAYGVAVVEGTGHPAQARAFISGLLNGAGRQDLLKAGFLLPR